MSTPPGARGFRAGVLFTGLVLIVCATAVAGLLFALPDDLPHVPGWWNLAAAAVWALLAFGSARMITGTPETEVGPSMPDEVWEQEVAGHLRLRGRHTDARIREVVDEARADDAGTGRPLIARLGPPDAYARSVPAQPGVEARRSAWQQGVLAGAVLLLVGISVSDGDLGWSVFLGATLAFVVGGSAVRSWWRARALPPDEIAVQR